MKGEDKVRHIGRRLSHGQLGRGGGSIKTIGGNALRLQGFRPLRKDRVNGAVAEHRYGIEAAVAGLHDDRKSTAHGLADSDDSGFG